MTEEEYQSRLRLEGDAAMKRIARRAEHETRFDDFTRGAYWSEWGVVRDNMNPTKELVTAAGTAIERLGRLARAEERAN